MIAAFIASFTTLFVVIDPIGLVPMFVALTEGMDGRARRKIALRACLIAALLLAGFCLGGEAILTFLGIGFPAFRIAGGLLLFLIAIEMLFEKRTERREKEVVGANLPDPSVFPLATPLIAGPGAMASIVLLAGQTGGSIDGIAVILAALMAVIILVFIGFSAGGLMERAFGNTGVKVITRLLGILLAALSVQFVIDGLRDLGVLL